MSLEIGQILEQKYRIVRLLGNGGMGAVFEGENTRIARRVAIKVLHAHVSGQAETVTRFEREAQAAGRIGSEHICEVLDLGTLEDGSRFMVMEYLDGETLSDRIRGLGRLTPRQTIPIMMQLLKGLAAAHAARIIHRDLKPDNIFILSQYAGRTDFVKILDFGVSKFSPLGDDMSMTKTGAVVGTPYYMSPEQARGGTNGADARSDIYSLGVLLYQTITGQVPHQASTFNELLFKIALELPPPPQQFVPDLDSEFTTIVQKAMDRDPNNRFQTCEDFAAALQAWHAGQPTGEEVNLPVNNGATVALPASAYQAPRPAAGMPAQAPQPAAGQPAAGSYAAQQGGQQQQQPAGALSQSGQQGEVAVGYAQGGYPSVGASGVEMQQGAPTADGWGQISGVDAPPQKSPATKIIIAAVAAMLLSGGAVAVYSLTGTPAGPAPAASTEGEGTVVTPPPSAEPTATAAGTEEPIDLDPPPDATASASASADPTAPPVVAIVPTTKPTTTATAEPPPTAKPTATQTAAPPPTAKPTATAKTSGGTDFGY